MTVINSKGYPDPESLSLVADIQYHEPFGSAALNRKNRGIFKKGIYCGFTPVAGDGLTITLQVDSDDGGGTASFDIGDYYQLTIRQQKNISVTVEAGTTKIIALKAIYALGTETYQVNSSSKIQAAEIVLLDELSSDEELAKNQLELCTVTIPSGTTQVTSDMIDVSNRVAQTIGIELSNSLTGDSETVAASEKAIYLLKKYADERFGVLCGVVGQSKNISCSIAAASKTATFTAEEIVTSTALGGIKYLLSNISLSINLATTGAGGMDSGTAPASGAVAIYVIHNPTTGKSNLLAVNATSSAPSSCYSGNYMPEGYTSSALISIWRTNSSSQLIIGIQTRNRIMMAGVSVKDSTQSGTTNALSAIDISSAIPKGAKKVIGTAGIYNNTDSAAYSSISLSSDSSSGSISIGGYSGPNIGPSGQYELDIVTDQVIWISIYSSSGTSTYRVYCTAYEI